MQSDPPLAPDAVHPVSQSTIQQSSNPTIGSDQSKSVSVSEGDDELNSSSSSTVLQNSSEIGTDFFMDLKTTGLRRSPRLNPQLASTSTNSSAFGLHVNFSTVLQLLPKPCVMFSKICHYHHQASVLFDGTCNNLSKFVLNSVNDNDTCSFRDMLKQSDKHLFIEAMTKEMADHRDRNHWEVILRSSMPAGTKTLNSVWSFKRKRNPAGEITKYKARLCVNGSRQQWGINYW